MLTAGQWKQIGIAFYRLTREEWCLGGNRCLNHDGLCHAATVLTGSQKDIRYLRAAQDLAPVWIEFDDEGFRARSDFAFLMAAVCEDDYNDYVELIKYGRKIYNAKNDTKD